MMLHTPREAVHTARLWKSELSEKESASFEASFFSGSLTLPPIIMVQWKITLNERKLILEIHPYFFPLNHDSWEEGYVKNLGWNHPFCLVEVEGHLLSNKKSQVCRWDCGRCTYLAQRVLREYAWENRKFDGYGHRCRRSCGVLLELRAMSQKKSLVVAIG